MNRLDASAPLVPEVGTLDPDRVGRLRRLGYLLDNAIPIPGTRYRVGLDPIVGLVPGIGDLIGGLLSIYIVMESARMGVPRSVLVRMGWNVALDTLVGEVPLLGDLFDVGFKANMKNLALLEGAAREPEKTRRANRRFVALLAGGLLLLTAGTVALSVVFVRLLWGLFQ